MKPIDGLGGDITFLDLLNIISLLLGIANYKENVSQSDIQDALKIAVTGLGGATNEIHSHLKNQDIKIKELNDKLDKIISILEALK